MIPPFCRNDAFEKVIKNNKTKDKENLTKNKNDITFDSNGTKQIVLMNKQLILIVTFLILQSQNIFAIGENDTTYSTTTKKIYFDKIDTIIKISKNNEMYSVRYERINPYFSINNIGKKSISTNTTTQKKVFPSYKTSFKTNDESKYDYDKQIAFGLSCMMYFTDTGILPIVDLKNYTTMDGTGASMADSNGIFQFSFDGVHVGSHASFVMDGDMNPPKFNQRFPVNTPSPQAAIALPKKGNTYWLFHTSQSDSAYDNNGPELDLLFYAIIDMNANNGNGAVVSKKNTILKADFDIYGLTAVKHANGKDWWLVAKRKKQYGFYVFLVTSDTVTYQSYQLIDGGIANTWAQGKAVFNQQGNLFAFSSASGDGKTPLKLAKFDRCTGQFTLWKTLKLVYDFMRNKIVNIDETPAFSPSGKYLYTNSGGYICQFDLFALDIDSSRVVLDTTTFTNRLDSALDKATLMYDGKIYIDNWASYSEYFSVINQPDSPGIKCDYHFQSLPVQLGTGNVVSAYGLPNLPNFRLGAVPSADNQQNQTIYYCEGDSVHIQRKHFPYSSYKWYSGADTFARDATHYSLLPTGNSILYLQLKDSTCSCGNRTDTIQLIAVKDTAIHHSYYHTICIGDSLLIGNSIPNHRYTWYRSTSLISQNDSVFVHQTDTLIQQLIDTTLHCISHSDTFYITTQNCDTALQTGIYFQPNPAHNFIQYSISDSSIDFSDLQVSLIAINGAIALQKNISSKTGSIDISTLASGVYILSLHSYKQIKFRKKWVVY